MRIDIHAQACGSRYTHKFAHWRNSAAAPLSSPRRDYGISINETINTMREGMELTREDVGIFTAATRCGALTRRAAFRPQAAQAMAVREEAARRKPASISGVSRRPTCSSGRLPSGDALVISRARRQAAFMINEPRISTQAPSGHQCQTQTRGRVARNQQVSGK